MNLGTFGGHIGRDAELRTAPNGDQVINFPIGVETGTKAKPATMWVDCSLWGKRAESLKPYLLKGIKVTANGRVTVSDFKKKDGSLGYRVSLNIAEIDIHSAKPHTAPASSSPAPASDPIDDDMPF